MRQVADEKRHGEDHVGGVGICPPCVERVRIGSATGSWPGHDEAGAQRAERVETLGSAHCLSRRICSRGPTRRSHRVREYLRLGFADFGGFAMTMACSGLVVDLVRASAGRTMASPGPMTGGREFANTADVGCGAAFSRGGGSWTDRHDVLAARRREQPRDVDRGLGDLERAEDIAGEQAGLVSGEESPMRISPRSPRSNQLHDGLPGVVIGGPAIRRRNRRASNGPRARIVPTPARACAAPGRDARGGTDGALAASLRAETARTASRSHLAQAWVEIAAPVHASQALDRRRRCEGGADRASCAVRARRGMRRGGCRSWWHEGITAVDEASDGTVRGGSRPRPRSGGRSTWNIASALRRIPVVGIDVPVGRARNCLAHMRHPDVRRPAVMPRRCEYRQSCGLFVRQTQPPHATA